jgi:anti-sigma regulatory factor (Ser/Thr protein kinase)
VTTGSWRGPSWRVIDADCGQAWLVRTWISAAISSYRCEVDPGDVALAADELFANAVQHGPRPGQVLAGYCLWPAGIRVVVADGGGAGQPYLRTDTGLAEGGRGLLLVDALAAQWGSFRMADNQIAWCDFGQAMPARADDAWAWLRQVLSACDLSAPRFVRPVRPLAPSVPRWCA